MPKRRIDEQMVLDAAIGILREEGSEAVTVGNIAKALNCSVMPVYSSYGSMAGLWAAVEQYAIRSMHAFVSDRIDPANMFESTGRAFVAAAREEPELFRVFAAAHRGNVGSLSDFLDMEADPRVAEQIAKTYNTSLERARQLHLHMLIYTVGLSTLLVSGGPDLDPEEVFSQMETAFEAFAAQMQKEDRQ